MTGHDDDGDDAPFKFPDDCQLCGAPMADPDKPYILGGIISVPNDTGGRSLVCVCDACFRKRRGEQVDWAAEPKRH